MKFSDLCDDIIKVFVVAGILWFFKEKFNSYTAEKGMDQRSIFSERMQRSHGKAFWEL